MHITQRISWFQRHPWSVLSPYLCAHLVVDPTLPPAATSLTRVSTLRLLISLEGGRPQRHQPLVQDARVSYDPGGNSPLAMAAIYLARDHSSSTAALSQTGWWEITKVWLYWSNSRQLRKAALFPEPNFLCIIVWVSWEAKSVRV